MPVVLDLLQLALPAGTFHALSAGHGRPLLYLHGFPDHPPTARAFLGELAKSHRVVAPWLRGYAPSPLPGPYDVATLVADVVQMIEHLGAPVDLVGHDWGAVIAYALCAARPALVRRAVALSVPHPLTMLQVLRSTPAQLARSWYMALFQLPGAERIARARDFALIDRLWRTWSPGFTLPEPDRAELHACLLRSMPAPLGYYRALVRPVRGLFQRTRWLSATITTPLLQLHGQQDGCIQAIPESFELRSEIAGSGDPDGVAGGAGALPRGINRPRFSERVHEVIPNVGHFLVQEAPREMAARVAGWLA